MFKKCQLKELDFSSSVPDTVEEWMSEKLVLHTS